MISQIQIVMNQILIIYSNNPVSPPFVAGFLFVYLLLIYTSICIKIELDKDKKQSFLKSEDTI